MVSLAALYRRDDGEGTGHVCGKNWAPCRELGRQSLQRMDSEAEIQNGLVVVGERPCQELHEIALSGLL